MTHADRRPFVDSPVGDIDRATALASEAAARWGLPAPALIRQGMNANFAAGDAVLRVGAPSAPASASIELANRLTDHGLRVNRPARQDTIEGLEVAMQIANCAEEHWEPGTWNPEP